MSTSAEYKSGDKIFKDYVFKGYLGKGAYGRVYLVENHLGIPSALKVLHSHTSQKDLENERRGVEAVMRIRSNRIVAIQDFGETTSGETGILMEYVKDSLGSVLKSGKALPEKDACRYFIEILKGLQVLEENGIVHRDIKPANLFILEDIVKIGDFGFTRFTSGESSFMTAGLGSIEYSAPESFDDQFGFSVDLWSAAVVFYQMLTGKLAFTGESKRSIFKQIVTGKADLSLAPERYQGFFNRCFKKIPKERFADVEGVLDAFRKISGIAATAAPEFGADFKNLENALPEPKYHLRSEAMQVSEDDFKSTLKVDTDGAPLDYIQNSCQDNDDGTVTDSATGLMWQQSGADQLLQFSGARKYIDNLNQVMFAGYEDWRLPTIDEMASLLEPEKQAEDLYRNRAFGTEQKWCWSGDSRSPRSMWIVAFDYGRIGWNYSSSRNNVKAVRSCYMEDSGLATSNNGGALTDPENGEGEAGDRVQPLRSKPLVVSTDNYEKVFNLDENWKPLEYLQNKYQINGDGTIIDSATGLMWLRSAKNLGKVKEATIAIDSLNSEKFAGYEDWRLPTIDELVSLLEPSNYFESGYNTVVFKFHFGSVACLSSDLQPSGLPWYVDYENCWVSWLSDQWIPNHYVRAVRSISVKVKDHQLSSNFNRPKAGVLKKPVGWQKSDAKYQMRSKLRVVSDHDIQKIFSLEDERLSKYVMNEYHDNDDGTVTDEATGLTWMHTGSGENLTFIGAKKYARYLNQYRFVGYTDWRLPTIEELASLLEPQKQSEGFYIDPVFGTGCLQFWSGDKRTSDSAWYIMFDNGGIDWTYLDGGYNNCVRLVRSW